MGLRRKTKSPAVLSHEFVIQNHADTASCLVMGLLLGLMFEVPAKYTIIFIAVQYNVTYTTDDKSKQFHFCDYSPKDIATIFFYMLVAINLHAVIQEYILDTSAFVKNKAQQIQLVGTASIFLLVFIYMGSKHFEYRRINDEPNLTLERLSPFSYAFSGKILLYLPDSLLASCSAGAILPKDPKGKYSKVAMLYLPLHCSYLWCLYVKHLGIILMVPHYLVELIFHASRLCYFSDENKQKGFTIWALLFIMVRLLTLTLSVLTFGFGLARVENPGFSIADGNFNVLPVGIGCLGAVCLTQAWMMWKFINFQLKKWREHVKNKEKNN